MQEYSATYCLQQGDVLSEFFTESDSRVCGVEFESYILYFISPFHLTEGCVVFFGHVGNPHSEVSCENKVDDVFVNLFLEKLSDLLRYDHGIYASHW
ncbi:Hypothetical protein, putative [Bodo saltans]|uniref:Uncharacterized protein n=1 Tax=Bodo saltans TaxID=75058 RepID=A0A0S4IW69_BODSA|nr:Hypothetical protein, putative [Bodo saltans]|eukprot:CUG04419.1 Hypothetical protein, putative [Bodo saltans]